MDIYTYVNFVTGSIDSAQTGDGINLIFILMLLALLIFGSVLFFTMKSKTLSKTLKKIIGIGLPSLLFVFMVPVALAGQSYAAGSSSSLNAVVDTEKGIAYIENGSIQNTTTEDMQLIVSSSEATNAGLNMPGLQNANLKLAIGNMVIYNGNPFEGYLGNVDMYYVLSPGEIAQFTCELTGLDKQTAEALDGSGNSLLLRFKFYESIKDSYSVAHERQKVADYLYEVEYNSWNADKCNFLCECLGKTEEMWGSDTKEYKDYLRKEWGLSESDVQLVVQIRKYFEETDPYPILCTSCRNGNFIGRNFDWAYDDLDEFIIRTNNNGTHLKSIGVASSFFPQILQDAIGIESVLPMLTMDGINECGVAININVVPPDAFGATYGTNPGHERLCAGVVPRFVLDNAKTAKEAVELLENRDIFTVFFSEFHFMISDATESYIVECVNNELVVLQQNVSKPTAMSNFHVSNSEHYDDYNCVYGATEIGPTYAAHSMGIERYDLAMSNIRSVNSIDQMVDHMKPIYYENVNTNWQGKRFWSDKNGQPSVYDEDHIFSVYDGPQWDRDRIATFEHNQRNYEKVHATEDAIAWRLKSDQMSNGVCQTVHSSCYDIANRQLAVNVQERNVTFKFNLNSGWRENGKATNVFVNGDNVGLATSCTEPGSEWRYDPASGNLTLLNPNAVYSIIGNDTRVNITTPLLVGYSISIPKMDDAVAKVEVGKLFPTLAKGRQGVRAVPKGAFVKVTFTADEGCTFAETGTDTYEVIINAVNQDIVFGTTPGYALPTVN